MEVPNTMNPVTWLRKHLDEADPDLLRSMLLAINESRDR